MPVEAELRRKNGTGDLVDYVLVDDAANPQTGLADPTVDYGARTRLDTVVTNLESILGELTSILGGLGSLLTNSQLRAAPVEVADVNVLVPKQFNHMDLTYTGADVTQIVYKQSGTTVATLSLSYTGGKLASVTRS
jgi:hypothetical protein